MVAKRSKKCRSLWMSGREETSGWATSSPYHQVVPAFCTPIPTKSGAPVTSPGRSAGGVKSNWGSQGA